MQTVDHGLSGKPEAGDVDHFTFAGVVNPDLILSGWDGSTTTVTAHFGTYRTNDWLYVRDASDEHLLRRSAASTWAATTRAVATSPTRR